MSMESVWAAASVLESAASLEGMWAAASVQAPDSSLVLLRLRVESSEKRQVKATAALMTAKVRN